MSVLTESLSSGDSSPTLLAKTNLSEPNEPQFRDFEIKPASADVPKEQFHQRQPALPSHSSKPADFSVNKRLTINELTELIRTPLVNDVGALFQILIKEPELQSAFFTCLGLSEQLAHVQSLADVLLMRQEEAELRGCLSCGFIVVLLYLCTKQVKACEPPRILVDNNAALSLWKELSFYGADSFFKEILKDNLAWPTIKALEDGESKRQFNDLVERKLTEIKEEISKEGTLDVDEEEQSSEEVLAEVGETVVGCPPLTNITHILINGISCELCYQVNLEGLSTDKQRLDEVKTLVTLWKSEYKQCFLHIDGFKASLCFSTDPICYKQPYELVEWLCSHQDCANFVAICDVFEFGLYFDIASEPDAYKVIFENSQDTEECWRPEITSALILKKYHSNESLSGMKLMAAREACHYVYRAGLRSSVCVQVVPVSTQKASSDKFQMSFDLLNSLIGVVDLYANSQTNWQKPLTAADALELQSSTSCEYAKVWAEPSYQKAISVLNLTQEKHELKIKLRRDWYLKLVDALGENEQAVNLARYQLFGAIQDLKILMRHWEKTLEQHEGELALPHDLCDIAVQDLQDYTGPLGLEDTKLILQACKCKFPVTKIRKRFKNCDDFSEFLNLFPEQNIPLDALFFLVNKFGINPDSLLLFCKNKPLIYRGFYHGMNSYFFDVLSDKNVSSNELRWITTQYQVLQAFKDAGATQDHLRNYVNTYNPNLADKLSRQTNLELAWLEFASYYKGKQAGRIEAAQFDLIHTRSLHNKLNEKPVITLENEAYYLVPIYLIAPIYFTGARSGYWTAGAVCDFCEDPQEDHRKKVIFQINYQNSSIQDFTRGASIAHYHNPAGPDKDICPTCLAVKLEEQKNRVSSE
ncbi:hypothetical protein D5018_11400 [Parashewanella curva]|uniref:Uncharacterized protein n=1 Tax=Parashewanella curva TaxID=2338552 RepID=A0A3L8PY45_9GAMM|nr:hypothetical protein [Parashewanella curva]RLV59553.1 hypothetical protein D5018_11400 [Parashewanella curva]